MTLSLSKLRWAHLSLVVASLLAAVVARAADSGFTAGLSSGERAQAGISSLSAAKAEALDALVARDVKLAHEGGVTGFSQEFLERHPLKERVLAGIDTLSPTESRTLNRLVASAIALGPPPVEGFRYAPPAPAPKPAATETEVDIPAKLQVHGDVSFTIGGGGHGRSFYGTSADAYVVDPKHGFAVGVGFSEFRGKGLLELCRPYGPFAPVYEGPPYPASW